MVHFIGPGDENVVGMRPVDTALDMKFQFSLQKEIDLIQIVVVMEAEFPVIVRRVVDGINEFPARILILQFPSVKCRKILINHIPPPFCRFRPVIRIFFSFYNFCLESQDR